MVSIHMVQKHIAERGWVDIPAVGVSMYPWIQSGDVCRFIAVADPNDVMVGDIVLYLTPSGRLIGHRVHAVAYSTEMNRIYVCKGDSNSHDDPPVNHGFVAAKLSAVRKGRLVLRMDGWVGRIWTKIIVDFRTPARLIRWHLGK